jgi:hypothetical protein
VADLQLSAGWRRCRHCTMPFQPPADLATTAVDLLISGPGLSQLTAWVEGFCGRECHHAYALDVVARRSVWWLKHQPREGAA